MVWVWSQAHGQTSFTVAGRCGLSLGAQENNQPAAAPLSCRLQWLRLEEALGPLVSAISRGMVGRQVLGTRHHLAYLIRRCNQSAVAWRWHWGQLKLLLSDLTSAPTCCLLCVPRTHSLQGADEIRTECTFLQI